MATVVLTGDKELDRKLRNLKSAKAKSLIRKACREALRPVHRATIDNAPVRTGALRRAVKLRAVKRSRKRIGARVTITGQGAKAPAQEYGTKYLTGEQFMLGAAEAKRAEANQTFKRKATDLIEELTR